MPRLHNWAIWHLKWKPRDDHIAQRPTTYINTLPETSDAKQYAAFIGPEAFEQCITWHADALNVQGEIVINKTIGNTLSDRIQRSKASK